MINTLKLSFILFCGMLIGCGNRNETSSWKPTDGYISNKQSAIKIAEIVWLNVYGKSVEDEKPFTAVLRNDKIWTVTGTLAEGKLGGTAYIEIQKSDGKILMVSHGK